MLHPASISVPVMRIPIRGLSRGLFERRNDARTARPLYATGGLVQSLLMKQEIKLIHTLTARQLDAPSRVVQHPLMKKDANKTKKSFSTA